MPTWQLELGRIEHHPFVIESFDGDVTEHVVAFAPDVSELILWKIALAQQGHEIALPRRDTGLLSWSMPRARAPLDDLWLVVHTAARRYWLEVPYGICRAAPLHHAPPQLGPPRLPLDVAPRDVVLPWRTIEYALGWVAGWQLVAVVDQQRLGDLELIARRAAPGLPPEISLAATMGTRALPLEPVQPWAAEVQSVHAARFRFAPPSLGTRTYVQLSASAAGTKFRLDLPTSLANPSHRSATHLGARS